VSPLTDCGQIRLFVMAITVWRGCRVAFTSDFDLRTFSIRAYPVDKVPELRPGMSAYLDWRAGPMRRRAAQCMPAAIDAMTFTGACGPSRQN